MSKRAAETKSLSDDNTPTLLADLQSPGGGCFHFIGLHPRPPVSGNTTQERDEQIKRAATPTRHSDLPVAIPGDFNDVAWSWSAKRFKHHGQYLDTRMGRASSPVLMQITRYCAFRLISFTSQKGATLCLSGAVPRSDPTNFRCLL
ncbi:endonuclease/exonuclease/phosphatase family protein [Roseobacter sp.]|uniref:endonuclease/exonuclease/phosphatase family protein n=1 Tax=Roseobacter sp. TaxID=1907202 RepID=UPI00344F5A7B